MSFIFDAQTENPETLRERRRRLAEALASPVPIASNIGEGLAVLGQAIADRWAMSKADKQWNKGVAAAAAMINGGDAPAAAPPAPQTVPEPQPVPQPVPITTRIGQPVSPGARMPPEIPPPVAAATVDKPATTATWLNYANQDAIRNKPLNDRLVKALSFLPEMGITAKVFSGGQDSAGGRRTGSHRHDGGNAADITFYKDGRKLDWGDPKDVPIFEELVKRAKMAGITGIGAGPGYMQPGSMHIGFGTPAVWGAGGRSANAPEWLYKAYYGRPPGKEYNPDVPAVVPGQPVQPTQMAAGGQHPAPAGADNPAAISPPAATAGPLTAYQRAMLNSIERGGAADAPAARMQRQAILGTGASRGGGLLDAILSPSPAALAPSGVSPAALAPSGVSPAAPAAGPEAATAPAAAGGAMPYPTDPEARQRRIVQIQRLLTSPYAGFLNTEPLTAELKWLLEQSQPAPPVKAVEVGGRLVDPATGKVIYEPPPGSDAERRKLGLTPIYATKDNKTVILQPSDQGGLVEAPLPDGVTLSPGIQKIDLGTSWAILDRDGKVVSTIPKDVTGEAAARETGAIQGKAAAETPGAALTTEQTIASIDELLADPNLASVTGWESYLPDFILALLTGGKGLDLRRRIEQLTGKAFLMAYETLKGGGQITEIEGAKAENALARLKTAQTDEGYRQALIDFRDAVKVGYEKLRARAGGNGPDVNVPPPPAAATNPGSPPAAATNPGSPPPVEFPLAPTTAKDPNNPQPGEIVDGFRFKGGDKSKEENWEIVQ